MFLFEILQVLYAEAIKPENAVIILCYTQSFTIVFWWMARKDARFYEWMYDRAIKLAKDSSATASSCIVTNKQALHLVSVLVKVLKRKDAALDRQYHRVKYRNDLLKKHNIKTSCIKKQKD